MGAQGYTPILVLVLFVDTAHESGCGRENFIDKDKDSFLGRKLNSLADDVDKLSYGKVGGNEVLLLVDSRNVALLDLFANDLNAHVRT